MACNPGLNRVTLAHLPGLPPQFPGTQAHLWLASWGVAQQMQAQLDTSALPPIPRLPGAARLRACAAYPVALNAWLLQGDAQARQFTEQLGLALAALVMTLKLAPDDARAARPEWSDAHWRRWTQVQHLTLGGGVLSGELGRQLHASATHWIGELGGGVALTLPDEPRMLMLRGLGSTFREGPVVALDDGHTALKRGIVTLEAGEVTGVETMELVPTPYHLLHAEGPLDLALGRLLARLNRPRQQGQAKALLTALVDALMETTRQVEAPAQFGLSLSAHLDERGNVDPQTGTSSLYGVLAGLELQAELERRLRERLGHRVRVAVMHEGRAAALALPGADAALLLGTSVGGAFSPSREQGQFG